MAFEAKRLRVQLPCGETTLVDEGEPEAREPEVREIVGNPAFCDPGTWMYNHTIHPTTVVMGGGLPHRVERARLADLYYGEPGGCDLGGLTSWNRTIYTCAAHLSISPIVVGGPDRGILSVDADQLPVLRAQLEVRLKQLRDQLKEVEVAERAVAEHDAEG